MTIQSALGSAKQGSILVTTLIILVVLLALTTVTRKMNNQLMLKQKIKNNAVQAELMMYTGKEYLKQRIWQNVQSQEDLWTPVDYLAYPSQNPSLSFGITAQKVGIWTDYWVQGYYKTGNKINTSAQRYRPVHGYFNWPALTVLSKEATISLAGTATIHGDVALYNGKISKSYRYELMAKPAALHKGKVIDSSTVEIWEKITPNFSRTVNWINQNYAPNTEIVKIEDEGCANQMIVAKQITITGNAVINNCLLLGQKIEMKSSQTAKNSVFIATEQLMIDVPDSKQLEKPTSVVFFLAAKNEKSQMTIKGYPGIATYGAHAPFEQGVAIDITEKAKIQGWVVTNGFTQVLGTVQGAIITQNVRLQKNGTMWEGFLWNASIIQNPKLIHNTPIWTQFPIQFIKQNNLHMPYGIPVNTSRGM
jgi:cytoskeletal protein CcmA (bactofilin family)